MQTQASESDFQFDTIIYTEADNPNPASPYHAEHYLAQYARLPMDGWTIEDLTPGALQRVIDRLIDRYDLSSSINEVLQADAVVIDGVWEDETQVHVGYLRSRIYARLTADQITNLLDDPDILAVDIQPG